MMARRIHQSTPKNQASLKQSLVACNIYVSAGTPRDASLLGSLLELCFRGDNNPSVNTCRLVHAYADPIYDRSSFHLAGTAEHVARVASAVACRARNELWQRKSTAAEAMNSSINNILGTTEDSERTGETKTNTSSSSSSASAHPFVGFVDHISVMPLEDDSADNSTAMDTTEANKGGKDHSVLTPLVSDKHTIDVNEVTSLAAAAGNVEKDDSCDFIPTTPSGWAARCIGQSLCSSASSRLHNDDGTVSTVVYYYGTAHPTRAPLAQIRREKTSFFHSASLQEDIDKTKQKSTSTSSIHHADICTIGAPCHFVENYNIRLQNCDKKTAQSLTRRIRQRDGGLPGVEALTLPYSGHDDADDKWEVAANLLRPDLANADAVQQVVEDWQRELVGKKDVTVERAYRVGTTADQCLQVLKTTQTEQGREQHYEALRQRFQDYLAI